MSVDLGAPACAQLEAFLSQGFVALPGALNPNTARAASEAVLAAIEHPSGQQEPVARATPAHPACARALVSPTLDAAYDLLLGDGRWQPRSDLGSCVVRFPATTPAPDTGWHVDAGFGWETEADFMQWRVNVRSRGRALLLLVLLSDVGEDDAPTRLLVGSHVRLARHLTQHGERGQTLQELVESGVLDPGSDEVALATGTAGTVFVCHPFLVHAAQDHHGKAPRVLAQPAIFARGELSLESDPPNAVERAILDATRTRRRNE
ncbi:MAG: phytanoyl-CoA dioxygenase family protein [Polyangiaceae bacterium]|nr:phytanoyl-CoA dioxygenase family protein [Myxococcales bacterium]MCB9586127.1 phytanoyl-CoA dioxygenase family protein [Polyangiaceae bacterium]MCB9606805.1 phytanoyl-CoA dioxygenase family protein [Polyangiaceae bacterium]